MGTKHSAGDKFRKWQECRSVLDKKTRALQQEMDDFLAGAGAMPSDLLAEVRELQKKCVVLFDELVKAMNSP